MHSRRVRSGSDVAVGTANAAHECNTLRILHNVQPGASWGTLPAAGKRRWAEIACDHTDLRLLACGDIKSADWCTGRIGHCHEEYVAARCRATCNNCGAVREPLEIAQTKLQIIIPQRRCTMPSLLRPALHTCVAGVTYGCYDGGHRMWVSDGCRGNFRCHSSSEFIRCDPMLRIHGNRTTLRHKLTALFNCTCPQAKQHLYVAEDGDARKATVSQVAELNFDPPATSRRCNATIVMIDDRRHVPLANDSQDIRYFHKAMMLNLLYAQRHRMSFLIVRPTAAEEDSWLDSRDSGLCPAWCRVKIIASLVASRLAAHGCHWVLYIDSDAYIREQHVDFLERFDTPANRDVHFAFAREELPGGGYPSPRNRSHGVRVASLNAGVLFLRASAWSARLLAVWMRASQLPVCAPFRQEWPCEQQCLHELLRNRTLLPEGWRTRIASVPMQLFNSPHGQFIRHVWGGTTGAWVSSFELRRKAFDDELRVQGVFRWEQKHALFESAQRQWIDSPC